MKKHRVLKGILLAAEAVVLIVLIGGLYVYGQLTERLSIVSEAPEVTLNDEGKISKGVIVTNEEVPRMTGYRTFALFGIDHRDQNEALSGENSDTMIICSINNDTQKVRLVSIYRDTLLNIGDDIYSKANAAYAYGGPQQAVNMLNMNLDLAITDYITIDFNALAEAVDALGGLSVPLSYAEIVHMNNYCVETAEETGKSYTPVELPEEEPEDQEEILGLYDLNGVQVTSYCRIRYTSSLDMGRTERQRRVIGLLATKAVSSGLPAIMNLMDRVFPMVRTSLSQTEILSMLPHLMGYEIDMTGGFPMIYKFSDVRGSIIVPMSLSVNVSGLHEFFYAESGYEPSSTVEEYSNKILEIVGGAEKTRDEAPAVTYEKGDAEDIFIWQDNGSGGNTYEDYGYMVTETESYTEAAEDLQSDPGTDSYMNTEADTVTTEPGSVPTSAPADEGTAYDPGSTEQTPDGGTVPEDPGVQPEPPAEPAYTDPAYTDGGGGDASYTDGGGSDASYTDGGGGDPAYTDGGGSDAAYTDGSGDLSYDSGEGAGEYIDAGSDTGYDVG